ncbi:beta heavy chain of outer-arm axonemal dynein ATPase [Apostichopus japonicus]|uniref:Beta heavy chain of outer-arm axonemal dynein ATPase n=1 Tax=Stichopus japonicus TaxID=307972 RepID=A0A2G8JR55_STIJA|nr:beta heavy chain of outer-arm axonemal dynein ATPase [Apostichopus japonicus]
MEESVDAVLDPILGRNTIKKGRYIKIGDKEVEYNSEFRLILHTKLANPHYKPEMQAQTTLINFTVTRDGLEDQLLANVVAQERPDLEKLKQQKRLKIVLKELEDNLLSRLSSAEGNFLGDTALVENLETTKRTAAEIEVKVEEAKVTEVKINEARELYRPAAARASLLYFILNDLNKINPIYQFSLKAFNTVFSNAIARAEPAEEVKDRVVNLIDCITYFVYVYTTRGLFEADKLIFTTQVALQVLIKNNEINQTELDFLLRFPIQVNVTSPVDFLSNQAWGAIKVITAQTDIAFTGVDPLKDVEALGKKLGFAIDNGNFHNVSLGQGQEIVAEQAMDLAAKEGHWVVLQNIHLVAKWLSTLEKKLESIQHRQQRSVPGLHERRASWISRFPHHPSGHPGIFHQDHQRTPHGVQGHPVQSLLLPRGVAERRKFGPQGWNRVYPFNTGDLTISVYVLYNYLEANAKVPWEDLRYLFGEIMYGGHITDDWDRRLCMTYLEEYMHSEMLDGELYLAPGFPIPPNTDYKGYHQYIDEMLPPESPYLYGLHPNAEIGFLTTTSDNLFKTVLEMQPRDSGSSGGGGSSREEKLKTILDEIVEKLPEEFNMMEIMGKVEEITPYSVVAFQECERMKQLTNEIRRSLKELDLGLKGELTITADMEELSNALFLNQVPESWNSRAYPVCTV